jgi:hypothetical protein
MGGPITVGSRNCRSSKTASGGSIPVAVGPPGQQQVDGDGGASQVGSHDPRQGLAAGPRRSVRDEPAPVHGRLVHRDVDDAAAAGGQHARRHLPRHQEVSGQVGLDHRAEPGDRHLPEAQRVRHEPRVEGPHADPRVVHQQVNATQPRPGLLVLAGGRSDPSRRAVVPDLDRAARSGGWLLAELGYQPFQRWADGIGYRLGPTYIVLERSPEIIAGGYERRRPWLNHLVLQRRRPPARRHPGKASSRARLDAVRGPASHAGGPDHHAAHLETSTGTSSRSSLADQTRNVSGQQRVSLRRRRSDLTFPGQRFRRPMLVGRVLTRVRCGL